MVAAAAFAYYYSYARGAPRESLLKLRTQALVGQRLAAAAQARAHLLAGPEWRGQILAVTADHPPAAARRRRGVGASGRAGCKPGAGGFARQRCAGPRC